MRPYRRQSSSFSQRQQDLSTITTRHEGRPDRLYIERRILRGEYPREIARDLWYWLRRTLKDLRYQCDEERAAQLSRQLAYLCSNYDTDTRNDAAQGLHVS